MIRKLEYNKVDLILLLTLMITPLTIMPINPFYDYFYQPKVMMMTIFVVMYLLVLLSDRKNISKYFSFDTVNKVLLIYFMYLIVSILFAQDKFLAFYGHEYREEGILTIALYMTLFLAGRRCSRNEKIYELVLISAVLVAVYGIMQHFGLDPIPRDGFRINWNGTFSTMGNPNFLGSYLVLMIPLSIHLFIAKNKNPYSVVYAILLYCLLCTRTRGAWLGAIAGISTYVFISFKINLEKKYIIKRILIILLISVVVLVFYNVETGSVAIREFLSISTDISKVISGGEEADKAGSGRIFIWTRTIELIKMKPWFGHGIENLHLAFSQYYESEIVEKLGRKGLVDKAHNEYLHIAVTSGIPALILYLSFITLTIRKGLNSFKKMPIYFAPILASVIGYLVQAFFNISIVAVVYVFWIFLGMLSTEGDIELSDIL